MLPNSPPVVGNSLFGVRTMQLLPNNLSFLLIGFSNQLVPIPGSPPTSAVLANPAAVLALISDANGRTSYPLALPNASALIGLPLSWQSVDIDASLPFAIPIANSNVLTTTLGAF